MIAKLDRFKEKKAREQAAKEQKIKEEKIGKIKGLMKKR